jgi:Cu2+-exporting ATPase
MERQATLKIPAIHCDGCTKTITGTLGALPGVTVGDADVEAKLVRVRFDDSLVKLGEIMQSLEMIGFAADSE